MTYLSVEDVIGWKSEFRDGYERLTQVRIHELVEEQDGPYATQLVHQIRVLESGGGRSGARAATARPAAGRQDGNR